jgi:formylglycine-generating enzyme required for sulfatase activity
MESTVRSTLRALIVRFGHALCDDPRRCEAMLRDLCGQHKREVFILVSALRQRVAIDLLAGSGLPPSLMIGRLRKRLEDELALTAEAAQWTVETWAVALGVIVEPSPPCLEPPVVPVRSVGLALEPELVPIPAGRFLMGSSAAEPGRNGDESPQHWVQVPAFELGKYAVTFAEWDACGSIYTPGDQGWGRGRRPVIGVSWDDAQA